MTEDVGFSCRCGAFRGCLRDAGSTGTHIVCHCEGCLRAQRHFGVEANQSDGVGIFQTTPDRFVIKAGAEHLRLGRLSPKGAFRWYAACCQSQVGATASTAKFPFVGILTTLIDAPEVLGPVRAHAFVPLSGGGTKHKNMGRMVMGMASRSIAAFATGRWRQTPFFDIASGQPVAKPELLPKDAGAL